MYTIHVFLLLSSDYTSYQHDSGKLNRQVAQTG